MPKKRKYLSEYTVNLCSSRWLLMPADQVSADGEMPEEAKDISKNCHIYLICRRPATYYKKESFSYEDGRLRVELGFKTGGKESTIEFDNNLSLSDDAVELRVSDYPYRELNSLDSDGNEIERFPASSLSTGLKSGHLLKRLEVLYVGQAFGNGSRTAHERLKNHATLQKILAECSYKYPDSEVSVLMFEYEPYRLIISMDGTSKSAISGSRDMKRFISIQENPLSLKQQIGLAEAALIRYFQPEFNKVYKLRFPSPKLKILRACYDLDFSGLCVEINTDELGFALYSETKSAREHHICSIDLVSHENRASFFHTKTKDGQYVVFPGVIGSTAD